MDKETILDMMGKHGIWVTLDAVASAMEEVARKYGFAGKLGMEGDAADLREVANRYKHT